jgi:hypothetical protein
MFSHSDRFRTHMLAVFTAIVLTAFPACKFGNYEKDPPGPSAIQGYYETLMNAQITVCATRPVVQPNGVSQDQTNCAQVPSSHADPIFSYVMTDPVDLAYDTATGLFFLTPINQSNPQITLPVISDNSGGLSFSGSIAPFTNPLMATHPNCVFNLSFTEQGTYGRPTGPFTTDTGLPLSGRIAMNFVWDYAPSGADCAQWIEPCYQNASSCSAVDQQVVSDEYSPFVDAGVLSISDLPNVEKLEYQVSYQ